MDSISPCVDPGHLTARPSPDMSADLLKADPSSPASTAAVPHAETTSIETCKGPGRPWGSKSKPHTGSVAASASRPASAEHPAKRRRIKQRSSYTPTLITPDMEPSEVRNAKLKNYRLRNGESAAKSRTRKNMTLVERDLAAKGFAENCEMLLELLGKCEGLLSQAENVVPGLGINEAWREAKQEVLRRYRVSIETVDADINNSREMLRACLFQRDESVVQHLSDPDEIRRDLEAQVARGELVKCGLDFAEAVATLVGRQTGDIDTYDMVVAREDLREQIDAAARAKEEVRRELAALEEKTGLRRRKLEKVLKELPGLRATAVRHGLEDHFFGCFPDERHSPEGPGLSPFPDGRPPHGEGYAAAHALTSPPLPKTHLPELSANDVPSPPSAAPGPCLFSAGPPTDRPMPRYLRQDCIPLPDAQSSQPRGAGAGNLSFPSIDGKLLQVSSWHRDTVVSGGVAGMHLDSVRPGAVSALTGRDGSGWWQRPDERQQQLAGGFGLWPTAEASAGFGSVSGLEVFGGTMGLDMSIGQDQDRDWRHADLGVGADVGAEAIKNESDALGAEERAIRDLLSQA